MDLFPAQPDLSLQISLPNTNSRPTETWERNSDASINLEVGGGHHHHHHHHHSRRSSPVDSLGSSTSSPPPALSRPISKPTTITTNGGEQTHLHCQDFPQCDLQHQLQPITGVPVYYNRDASPFPFVQHQPTNRHRRRRRQPSHPDSAPPPRLRIPAKRIRRAPRIRWSTTLHTRFVHAVELLGGHERATPKSVLELMDVKDLTLAHVKSHLQMYRSVKSTNRSPAFTDNADCFENGSAGVISGENVPGIRNLHEASAHQTRSPMYHCTTHGYSWFRCISPPPFLTESSSPLCISRRFQSHWGISDKKIWGGTGEEGVGDFGPRVSSPCSWICHVHDNGLRSL
ncbi:unnamed protein product [Spirodela intermedia]|uniref:Uncharacterized protein n=1 Tax=Spirodela intermedia TaxID=51605 RepID=A0A7I8JAA8_SPIIN|nr:unnamed protein product [Spirodela intermedia]CAA6667039.1 unnamed protein product [Spirodela intermedia]